MSNQYNRKDSYYLKAKDEGFRSRATFKLEEIDKKYKLIKPGFKIVDLGAWPGGWLQYAARIIGSNGTAVGIDLKEIEDFGLPNIKVLTGDVRDESILFKALEYAPERFDLVLSDMSPKLSGIKEVDRYGAVGLAELALWVCGSLLKPGGNFALKLFKSPESEAFVKTARAVFNSVKREELDSTRKSSNEYYLICLGFSSSSA